MCVSRRGFAEHQRIVCKLPPGPVLLIAKSIAIENQCTVRRSKIDLCRIIFFEGNSVFARELDECLLEIAPEVNWILDRHSFELFSVVYPEHLVDSRPIQSSPSNMLIQVFSMLFENRIEISIILKVACTEPREPKVIPFRMLRTINITGLPDASAFEVNQVYGMALIIMRIG